LIGEERPRRMNVRIPAMPTDPRGFHIMK
jgi:hypothetical protein